MTLRSRHHFLITFTKDAFNGNANQTRKLLDNTTRCLNPVFLLNQPRNYQDGTNLAQRLQRGPTTWKDMLEKCVERYCELANKKTEQQYEVSHPCLDDHQIKKEELENKGDLSEVCSHIVSKCLYLARIGRPDILWLVNKLARSVTKWTQACDRRLARLISYILFTSDHRQYCHVGNAAQHSRLGLFQDSDLAGDLQDSKSTSGGVLCIFGSRMFVPISWVCKKQTSVSHSSTESEIISLDAGCVWTVYLRLTNGISPLKCWERPKEYQNQPKHAHGKQVLRPESHQDWTSVGSEYGSIEHRSSSFERTSLCERITVVHFRRQRICDTDDHQRQKSDEETCVSHPKSCSGLVIWQNQPGPESPNQVCRIHKPTRRHFNERQLHAWWMAQLVASLFPHERHHIFP